TALERERKANTEAGRNPTRGPVPAHDMELLNTLARRASAFVSPWIEDNDFGRVASADALDSPGRFVHNSQESKQALTAQLVLAFMNTDVIGEDAAVFNERLQTTLLSHSQTRAFCGQKARAQRHNFVRAAKDHVHSIYDQFPASTQQAIAKGDESDYKLADIVYLAQGTTGIELSAGTEASKRYPRLSPIMYEQGRYRDARYLMKARHAFRLGRLMICGASALRSETQEVPSSSSLVRMWKVTEITPEFIATVFEILRYQVLPDKSFKSKGDSGYDYQQSWLKTVEQLYKPHAKSILDAWNQELLGWQGDTPSVPKRGQPLSAPRSAIEDHDDELMRQWEAALTLESDESENEGTTGFGAPAPDALEMDELTTISSVPDSVPVAVPAPVLGHANPPAEQALHLVQPELELEAPASPQPLLNNDPPANRKPRPKPKKARGAKAPNGDAMPQERFPTPDPSRFDNSHHSGTHTAVNEIQEAAAALLHPPSIDLELPVTNVAAWLLTDPKTSSDTLPTVSGHELSVPPAMGQIPGPEDVVVALAESAPSKPKKSRAQTLQATDTKRRTSRRKAAAT
ncbi:hypothetical protein PHLGIDRAFT_16854, partial [Phlebiopsis gigantea 11061_1 CR5-6]